MSDTATILEGDTELGVPMTIALALEDELIIFFCEDCAAFHTTGDFDEACEARGEPVLVTLGRRIEELNAAIEDPHYGHCDTCGAHCDAQGCTVDRTHVAAIP